MTKAYWQAKIWGLLHQPLLKNSSSSNGQTSELWKILACMTDWVSPTQNTQTQPHNFNQEWLTRIGLSESIASASDRTTIDKLPNEYSEVKYNDAGIAVHHLLSGKPQQVICDNWHDKLIDNTQPQFLENIQRNALNQIKDWQNPQKVHWWLWRCYPEIIAGQEANIHLLPAETKLPDASIWSQVTMTSAIAGGLAGYYNDENQYPQTETEEFEQSRPYLTTFSFSPVQELIKASRKMRDFWAGSWLLHYLSAKVAWAIAFKYGADTLLYPCLYEQPLIDHWLLQKYPDFAQWIKKPATESILTAGFPNVLVMILPNNGKDENTIKNNPVKAAMEYADNTLKKEWQKLGDVVLTFIQNRHQGKQWQEINLPVWNSWLKAQWQSYWVSIPMGNPDIEQLSVSFQPQKSATVSNLEATEYNQWIQQQNNYANPQPGLFLNSEQQFLEAVFVFCQQQNSNQKSNLNVGSWWASTFDQLRYSLNAVKNARNWKIPTCFAPQSTISGIGSVAHPVMAQNQTEWVTEGETRQFWTETLGLFDGIEQLNPSEILKRVLHQILLAELYPNDNLENTKVPILYPDLSSGVAGYLRSLAENEDQEAIDYYHQACQSIVNQFPWANQNQESPANLPWGIPWIAKHQPKWLNPRLLNAGWLIDEFNPSTPDNSSQQILTAKKNELVKLRLEITKHYQVGNNPTDWYILAAGDGDGMGEWLRGNKLKAYNDYIPEQLKAKIAQMPENLRQSMSEFLTATKRMGPSTHSALSRALLDFSNRLVPYLTQERYAGRLIYGGGDDVLAYTNLWEWDSWLWDLRQCFQGKKDPQNEFVNKGDYWQWGNHKPLPESLSARPLFTMGGNASISFGITIAHHSVPMAIALENLWEAEEQAKQHEYNDNNELYQKDALQVRVIYGSGNILKATAKFETLDTWRQLISLDLTSSIFEVTSEYLKNYPIPTKQAILPWIRAFSERRTNLEKTKLSEFQVKLADFVESMWNKSPSENFTEETSNWLRLAAFVIRNREIKIVNS